MDKITQVFLIGLMVCFITPAWAAPKLAVDQTEYNFGVIYQGENVAHTFKFSNKGDKPLIVEKVRSSCGCTAALASTEEVLPGESGEIQSHFDSSRFRGPVSKTIYLYTNDLTQPVIQLFIKGTVKPMLKVSPQQVNLGKVPSGEISQAMVMLVNQSAQLLTLERPQSTAQELKADLETLELVAGQASQMRITLLPKPGQSRFSGYVLVKVTGSSIKEIRVPVYAVVEP